MKNNFSLKFRILDIFIIVGALVISCLFFFTFTFKNTESRVLEITHQNTILEQYKIDLKDITDNQDIVLKKEDYPRLLDDFVIEISNKKGVRVKSVTCDDHTCYKQRWVNIINLPIICIPNDVIIKLISPEGDDVMLG